MWLPISEVTVTKSLWQHDRFVKSNGFQHTACVFTIPQCQRVGVNTIKFGHDKRRIPCLYLLWKRWISQYSTYKSHANCANWTIDQSAQFKLIDKLPQKVGFNGRPKIRFRVVFVHWEKNPFKRIGGKFTEVVYDAQVDTYDAHKRRYTRNPIAKNWALHAVHRHTNT